ncbi:MAG: hypothetical protein KC766_22105 [Myxococcales bacterium]|nr:hypothetical protein [Myxococcales bacterium]
MSHRTSFFAASFVAASLVAASLVAVGLLATACASSPAETPTPSTALGWRPGPGFSCNDSTLFEKCPEVVQRGDEWFLRWTYGSDAFYYTPNYEPRDGRLVFSLRATTSTGNPSGKSTALEIEDEQAIRALRQGGAVWWEPDGSYVPLRVVPE